MPLAPFTVNDGSSMPAIGFGTWPLKGEGGIEAMVSALRVGYRLLDTAVNYENEAEVGEAVRRSGLDPAEVTVQTKIPGRDHEYEKALASLRGSKERLGVEQLDAALIHWPNPSVGKYHEAWRALVEARRRGWVRTIGVSNFGHEHLQRIIEDTGVVPAVNQVECHPLFPQKFMRGVNADLGIVTQAWSPLGKQTAQFDAPAIANAAVAHDVSPGQVILRWHVQQRTLPLPKSTRPERQRENLDVDGFELSAEEMEAVSALGRDDGRRFDGDPDLHEEM